MRVSLFKEGIKLDAETMLVQQGNVSEKISNPNFDPHSQFS